MRQEPVARSSQAKVDLVNTAPPKIKEILDKTTAFFRQKQLDTPRLDAELLIGATLGLRRIDLYLKFDQPLSEEELEKCRSAVRRRTAGEPVAYILGQKDFYGQTYLVNSNVLIPRPETELLAEEVLLWAKKHLLGNNSQKILDLGTGSGCLALTLLRELPGAEAWAVDISPDAITVASQNAKNLECESRARFLAGDAKGTDIQAQLNEAAPGGFQIIVANPPYIDPSDTRLDKDVKSFEPSQALFAGENGMAEIRGWLKAHSSRLTQPGILAFEFGAGQGSEVNELFASMGVFDEIRIIKDLAGHERHALGMRNGI